MRVALALAWLVGLAAAQDATKPKLPRVLLVGDGALGQRLDTTVKALGNRVVAVRSAPGELPKQQQQRWNVICLHVGVRDGEQLSAYDKRLESLIAKLQESCDRVLWLRPPVRDANPAAEKADKAAIRRMIELEVEIVDLRRKAPNTPLAKAILRLRSQSVHKVEHGAHCDRCRTIWGAKDLRTCRLHLRAGVVMDPRCRHCRYHGAYKFIFAQGVTKEQEKALRRGKQPATRRPGK